jgi:hypothetical protein
VKRCEVEFEFVEFVPREMEEGTLYISTEYATAVHRCCCGCGAKVTTPLAPAEWRLIFDGKTVSLEPSIGNWSFPCQSHYWIRRNRVAWSGPMTKEEIATVRRDRVTLNAPAHEAGGSGGRAGAGRGGVWSRIRRAVRVRGR